MTAFAEFFQEATASETRPGFEPHGYQARIAQDGLPDVVEAPTGTGKTGVILAWLWRLLYGPEPDRAETPRRLVYALPQRSLVEQVAGEAERWVANLRLTSEVAVHVVMGGEGKTQGDWRQNMHQPAIVVGTVDSLVSKALNRGYGIGRGIYPIDFALVTNGAHWVIDEIQLCPESTTTLRQLAAFAQTQGWRPAEPFGLTCMSATVDRDRLLTVDNSAEPDVLRILPEERTGELAVRLNAARTVRRLDAEPGAYPAIAAAAATLHRDGALTLVVLNTVDAARAVYKALAKQPTERMLLHSRFRGADRTRLMELLTDGTSRIVVATQVVEAGIDINASVLITEAAPWPSLVQRAGRCNRTGMVADAGLWWIPPGKPQPYEQADIDASCAELAELDGEAVTGEDLLIHGRDVAVTQAPVAVLRRPDFIELFDTSPDLSGADLDIAPYVRDAEDLDVQLAWATWTAGPTAAPPADAKSPTAEYRCRVPLGELAKFMKQDGVIIWRLDQVAGAWTRVTSQARARPGEVLLVAADAGGYSVEVGFDPAIRTAVPGGPELNPKATPATGTEDAYRDDSGSVLQRDWQKLDEHSEKTRHQAEKLLEKLEPTLPDGAAATAITAAYLHDVGKAHPIWQDALCDLATAERKAMVDAGRPWAKSGGENGRLLFKGGVSFRHELASLLILDGPLRPLLDGVPDVDLARYLVLAHHGKLRVQVRDPGDLAVIAAAEADEHKILGLKQGARESLPVILGQPEGELVVDVEQFWFGAERSWTRTALALRDRYGPFVLAYLEAIVRIADWRASAGDKDPE
jgi:CRISPR-associated endonuclease/helicase Cas3